MPDTEDKSNIRNDSNDMCLSKMFVPDIPKDIIFPEELNTYLRDQVQYLTHENGMLKKNLSETELKLKESTSEVQTLTKEIQQYECVVPANSFSSISNVASSKIVELSKKLREKSSDLEVIKTKCSKLEQQIYLLQQAKNNEHDEVPEKERPSNELEDQMKQLQDKLNSATRKIVETRNANIQLKNDLKMANKFLQQEVGDNFETLQSIVNGGCNWRGRAQMVCDLQQKNAELREKLKAYQDKGFKPIEPPAQIKSDRRYESLTKENLNLKSELYEMKKKLEGARARYKYLESESSVVKSKVSMLTEQQDNDRQLIATLTGQLSNTKNAQMEDARYKEQMVQKLQKDYKNLYFELTKEKCKNENLQKELQDKIFEIGDLKQIKTPNSLKHSDVNNEQVIHLLEAERIRLLELSEITNKRLEVERESLNNCQSQLRVERQKRAKLESKIARLELDHSDKNSIYSNHSSRSKDTDKTLEDQLELAEENIKTLKTRLEIEQRERKLDFEEFSKILKNYTPSAFEIDSL